MGQKKPIMINGKPLYDIYGNVWKWMQDSWDGRSKLSGGVDPVGVTGSYRVLRGGSSTSVAGNVLPDFRYFNEPSSSGVNVGFRLVSDIP